MIRRLLILIPFFAFSLCPISGATTIEVTNTTDKTELNGDCTLREAITAANLNHAVDACPAGSASDTIVLTAGEYPIQISGMNEDNNGTGDFDIHSVIVFSGPSSHGTAIINGNGLDRVLDIHDDGKVGMMYVTITGGDATGYGGGAIRNNGGLDLVECTISNSTANLGGAINNGSAGHLDLDRCTLESNTASGSGGAIFDERSGAPGTHIADSWFSANSAARGGAIYGRIFDIEGSTFSDNTASEDGGAIRWPSDTSSMNSAVNCTFSGNRANGSGGALAFGGYGLLEISNVTITDNTADDEGNGDGSGGGVMISSTAHLRARNSIIAGNHLMGRGPIDPAFDCFGTIESYDYNLVGVVEPGVCSLTSGTGDLFGSTADRLDPQLEDLAADGNSIAVHEPRSTSPVIDHGNPAGCEDHEGTLLTTDQIASSRHIDGPDPDRDPICDIGAVENAQQIFSDDFESGDLGAW
jgi:CSLREA domain-containing protein